MIEESIESIKRRTRTKWALLIFHFVAIVGGYYFFSWQAAVVCFVSWYVTNKAVGVCFHRLLTHRSFKTWKWVEYGMTIFACNALQTGPISWAQMHWGHHANTDEPMDPHSPREHGFWWAQIGWMLYENPNIDKSVLAKYAPDLQKNEFHQWANKYWWTSTIGLAIILFTAGWFTDGLFYGFALVVYGTVVSTVIGWHITWLVNSVTHIREWGYRNFDELKDDSCNNPLVAIVTFGEGWHNNHHKYPKSARHGLKWWEIDTNYILIWMMSKVWLAWDINTPKVDAH